MHEFLSRLPRRVKQGIMVGTDALLLPVIVWAAFALRLGKPLPPQFIEVWWLILAVPALAIPCFAAMGLYRAVVRYLGAQAVIAVLKAVTLSALVFVALVAALRIDAYVPRTSYVLYWLLAALVVGGTRFTAGAWLNAKARLRHKGEPLAIYGAGEAGVHLAQALATSETYRPVLFVDDDPALHGTVVHGLRVYPPGQLAQLVERHGLTLVVLALPSASRSRRRQIIQALESVPVHVKTMPALTDILSGQARVDDVREVGIDDLLARDAVEPAPELMERCIRGRHVLVTGAGGSIGAELCRQIIGRHPATLVLFELNEYALYTLERELRDAVRARKSKVRVVPLLGSVVHQRRLEQVMRAFAIDTVYHAAAYKHVPIVEENVLEGVQNNIFGTVYAARAAAASGVERFVLISTDKAVRPTNVMGATKRFAELVLQALAQQGGSRTCFAIVRFGNVLGSSGSVVPLFRQQIAAGGPITVTHPEVTRYFMTIPEAASLVIQAGALASGGEVFVLDMGEPVKIDDLARQMVRLSGLEVRDEANPNGDIAITYTGLRPGEKLREELLIGNDPQPTQHPMILRARERCLPLTDIEERLDALRYACQHFDPEAARRILRSVVDGYQAHGTTHDLLWRQLQEHPPAAADVYPLPVKRAEQPEAAPTERAHGGGDA